MLKKMIVEDKKVHPKEMKLDETLSKNKGKTTLVYVEHEGLIQYFMKKYSKMYRCSFLKSAKNNTERIINDYTREAINQKKLDVVFTTSVTKLGMNLDVNELFLYHLPKNYKDLLQFSGRIGRFETKNGYRENNIYCLYPEGTMEKGMSFKVYREAKAYIDEFFGDDVSLRTPEKVVEQTKASVQAELFSTSEAPFTPRPGTKRKRWDKRYLPK